MEKIGKFGPTGAPAARPNIGNWQKLEKCPIFVEKYAKTGKNWKSRSQRALATGQI